MKRITLILLFVIVSQAYGQKTMDSYTASNGITYKEGDQIKLGRGSATNGDFLYLQMGGWAAIASYDMNKGSDQNNIGRGYSGILVTLKKIRTQNIKGQEKVYFTVGGGNITNYNLMIEDAIASCEIADCKTKPTEVTGDNLDKIKKLKALLDSGALTEAEFQTEKKKILN